MQIEKGAAVIHRLKAFEWKQKKKIMIKFLFTFFADMYFDFGEEYSNISEILQNQVF